MTDILDDVKSHYAGPSLAVRLKAALAVFGPEDLRLTPQQLATLDQFHTRGRLGVFSAVFEAAPSSL